MAKETNPNDLAARYDALYSNEAVDDQTSAADIAVQPVVLDGWPDNRKQAMLHLAKPGGRLLEIGCGQGNVLAALAPHYDELVGVELSGVRAARTQQALAYLPNCRIANEPLENLLETAVPPFDCIIWAEVIEHVVDVIGAMHI